MSILGISIIQLLKDFNVKNVFLYSFSYAIFAFTITAVILLLNFGGKYKRKSTLLEGYSVKNTERSLVSLSVSKRTIKSILVFGGDLSWLEKDIQTYAMLIQQKGIKIKILTDNPNSRIVSIGKTYGIEFRPYPDNKEAPVQATLYDTEYGNECRALVVKKVSVKRNQEDKLDYNYWFKEYHGEYDFMIISGLKNYFYELYEQSHTL